MADCDCAIFRDFCELVANSPDSNLNEDNWRALRADARNRLDVAKGGRLSNVTCCGDPGDCQDCKLDSDFASNFE